MVIYILKDEAKERSTAKEMKAHSVSHMQGTFGSALLNIILSRCKPVSCRPWGTIEKGVLQNLHDSLQF